MVTVASRYFEGVGFRGMFVFREAMRFTLMRFEAVKDKEITAQEEAELWALRLLLRWKAIYPTPDPSPNTADAGIRRGE